MMFLARVIPRYPDGQWFRQDAIGSGTGDGFTVLDSDGNSFSVPNEVLDADGNSFTASDIVLDADGNEFDVV